MKKLANLKGVRALNRMEQKSINGGGGEYTCTVMCKDGHMVGGLPNCNQAPDPQCVGRGGWSICTCSKDNPPNQ